MWHLAKERALMKRKEDSQDSQGQTCFLGTQTLEMGLFPFYVSKVLIGSVKTGVLLNGPGKTELNALKYLSFVFKMFKELLLSDKVTLKEVSHVSQKLGSKYSQ